MKPSTALAAALSVLAAASVARADPPTAPPPIALSLAPIENQAAWRWTITNTSSSPIDVLTDRRLFWIEQTQPPPLPNGRVRRLRRLGRCVHPARPTNHETAARTTLAPGQRYSEDVQLLDLCGIRLPAWVISGAPVTAHYGFAVTRRPSLLRTLTLDERSEAVNDLQVAASVPSSPSAISVSTAVAAGPALTATRGEAATGEGLRVSVRLTNTSVHPMVVPWRSSMMRFDVRTPTGRVVDCRALTRAFGTQRDYFVRLAGHRSLTVGLLPALYCPQGTFNTPGLYEAEAVFTNALDGHEYGFQRVFTGALRAAPATLRITRGNGRFVPLHPELSPAR